MEKITLLNLHKKEQYIAVVFTLAKFSKGLSLQELTYLLSDKKNMNKLGYLTEKFQNIRRREYFRSRQRICDVLRKMREIGLIEYKNGIYSLNIRILFYWCELRKAEKKYNDMFDNIEKKHPVRVDSLTEEITPITIMYNFKHLWEEYQNFDS